MIIFGIRIERVRRLNFRIVKIDPMTPEEIDAALSVTEKNPQWRAMLQLLDDYEEGARLNIGRDPDKPHLVTWNAGGAEYLASFKKQLIERRDKARESFRQNPRRLVNLAVRGGMRDGQGRRPGEEISD